MTHQRIADQLLAGWHAARSGQPRDDTQLALWLEGFELGQHRLSPLSTCETDTEIAGAACCSFIVMLGAGAIAYEHSDSLLVTAVVMLVAFPAVMIAVIALSVE